MALKIETAGTSPAASASPKCARRALACSRKIKRNQIYNLKNIMNQINIFHLLCLME
jgi:hypothetical protein